MIFGLTIFFIACILLYMLFFKQKDSSSYDKDIYNTNGLYKGEKTIKILGKEIIKVSGEIVIEGNNIYFKIYEPDNIECENGKFIINNNTIEITNNKECVDKLLTKYKMKLNNIKIYYNSDLNTNEIIISINVPIFGNQNIIMRK